MGGWGERILWNARPTRWRGRRLVRALCPRRPQCRQGMPAPRPRAAVTTASSSFPNQLMKTITPRSLNLLAALAAVFLTTTAALAAPAQQAYIKASNTDPFDHFG